MQATSAQPHILLVTTFSPQFLESLYSLEPTLAGQPYEAQARRLLGTKASPVDAYRDAFRGLGWRADVIVPNADRLQERWARDHGVSIMGNVHDVRRKVVAAQIEHHQPDVLYVFEWSPLGDDFLAAMKRNVRLLVGQLASPLRPERTYAAYDLMISSWPPIVDHFRKEGQAAAHLRFAFDDGVLADLPERKPAYDVTFVGGFAPSHPNRVGWLEGILAHCDVDVFASGLERVPAGSPIRGHYRGEAWGRGMYETLRNSRITLNLHAINDVRGAVATNFANNMRLYEATGVGTCLLTDAKDNLSDMFKPQEEVATFTDVDECVKKIRYLLDHDDERRTIARAGQERTLRDHTYARRIAELAEVLDEHLDERSALWTAIPGRR